MKNVILSFAIGGLAGLILTLVMTAVLAPDEDERRYIDLSGAAVVQQTQALGRLETTSFSIEKIIEAGTATSGIRGFLFGEKLLLIARGDVIAGVDLAEVGEEHMVITETRLELTLPPPTIFSAALRSGETRVYDRSQGILSRADKDLESDARAAAEEEILRAACDAGILDEARTNARRQLTVIFLAAGFSEVSVTMPPGNCGA